jgi:hypothetical protein
LWICTGFNADPDSAFRSKRIRIQGFDDKNCKVLQVEKIHVFFSSKIAIPYIYPLASKKDVQATEEAYSHQNRRSSTSKHEIAHFLVGLFVLLNRKPHSQCGSGSSRRISRLQNAEFATDEKKEVKFTTMYLEQ